MFVGKAVEHLKGVHSGRLNITLRHLTTLERPTRDKRSSLLRTFINYDRTMFYNTGPCCDWHFNLIYNFKHFDSADIRKTSDMDHYYKTFLKALTK
jgi:hypothetical protein